MTEHPFPAAMSLPEIMGDPCAGELRKSSLAILRAVASSQKLIRSHPQVAQVLQELRDNVQSNVSEVLNTLADEAGMPAEGESISPLRTPNGDYRVDRSSNCWIWVRTIDRRGYPFAGRKANGRENVPAKIYWMLAHGPLAEHEIVVRTCGLRLCVNPDHGQVRDRGEHTAEQMRRGSRLDWDAVREIRTSLCASREGMRERAAELAARYGIGEHSVLDVFRNKVWLDPSYIPGFDVVCAGPACEITFRTTSTVRKYHSKDCQAAAIAAQAGASRRRYLSAALPMKSPQREAREQATLQAELATAEAQWSDVVVQDNRTSVWTVTSIDQPLTNDGATLHDILPSREHTGDPAIELERKQVGELLGDLTEDAVAEMGEEELAPFRKRLMAAGMQPCTERRKPSGLD
jgi:molybdopterin converting factor small subunit